jgi:8-hydroxy-5-deazaflavin:NADPH oxidoreductase
MKIGIIGAGRIGSTAARLFAKAGHEVAVSNSRGPESLASLVAEIGSGTRAVTVDEAAGSGEIVLLAIPFRNRDGLPTPALVDGKIVIDATNPYSATGEISDLGDSTSSEEIAKLLPGATIIKAFNTIYFEHLAKQGNQGPIDQRRAIFVAGDDPKGKATVSRLIEEIGFAPMDSGSLREGGRKQQPGSPIYNRDLTAAQARQELASLG